MAVRVKPSSIDVGLRLEEWIVCGGIVARCPKEMYRWSESAQHGWQLIAIKPEDAMICSFILHEYI